MPMDEELQLTQIVDTPADFRPVDSSVYLSRQGLEERSSHLSAWAASAPCQFAKVTDESHYSARIEFGGQQHDLRLRSSKELAALWQSLSPRPLYLDITGLRHQVWAPILRSALEAAVDTKVVYVEPHQYQPSLTPTEGEIYDLSERIEGIAPIAGFASIARIRGDFCFVPLLGFEGTRVAFIMEHVQPGADRVIPIVGVPGFRPEFPFETYLGNRLVFRQHECWRQVRFADANCPFSSFYCLQDILNQFAGDRIKVAPIGTKPHALGAVLFALRMQPRCELVYDHPIRRGSRTSGLGRLLVYDVSRFLDSLA